MYEESESKNLELKAELKKQKKNRLLSLTGELSIDVAHPWPEHVEVADKRGN